MPAPATIAEFVELGCKAGLFEKSAVRVYCARLQRSDSPPRTPQQLATTMVRDKALTTFQAQQLLIGRWRGFLLCKKYRLLECIGSGGMGSVYLCEHLRLHRRVAVKVLPANQAKDPGNLERFYREARAVAALNHPNIVQAYDIDEDQGLHFLVMEYVEGQDLQSFVKSHGPLELRQAALFIAQAAAGLQHAHESGLVHRDIKPANLLLAGAGHRASGVGSRESGVGQPKDQSGISETASTRPNERRTTNDERRTTNDPQSPTPVVKILDMGLARFFHKADDSISEKHDTGAILGTADYLSPEQALDSQDVDIRSDIYSLGATFYFLLAGHAPFHDKSIAQKIVCHQLREPKPIRSLRPDVPDALAKVLSKMLAKKPEDRFQTPKEIARALRPWTLTSFSQRAEATTSNQQRSADVSPTLSPREKAQLPPTRKIVDSTAADAADTEFTDLDIAPDTADGSSSIDSGIPPQSSDSHRGAASPTDPSLSLEETDLLFAESLQPDTGSLISEESIFLPQVSRTGSTRTVDHKPLLRAVFAGLIFSLIVGVTALGSWLLTANWHKKTPPAGKNDLSQAGKKKTPLEGKSLYQPGSPTAGRILQTFSGLNSAITCVGLSPDATSIVVGGQERTLKVWDAETGKFRLNLIGHAQPVTSIAVAADGRSAVTVGEDGSLCYWDIHTRNRERFPLLKQPLYCVALSQNHRVVTGGKDCRLHLWNLKKGKVVRAFKGHTKAITAVDWAPDEQRVLTGSEDHTIRLWDVGSGKSLRVFHGHMAAVRAVAFSPDGRHAASAAEDGIILLWDANRGTQLQTYTGHSQAVTTVRFSPDGRYLLSAAADGTVRVWDVISAEELYRYDDPAKTITSMAVSSDGRLLVYGCSDRTVRLIQMPSFLQAKSPGLVQAFSGHRGVVSVASTPEGDLIASAGQDKIVRLWQTGKTKPVKILRGHKDAVLCVAFSPDGRNLLSGGKDKAVLLWDTRSGKRLQTCAAHDGPVHQVVFIADGPRFLSASEDGTVRLWDVIKGKAKVTREFVYERPVWALACSADGKKIAAAGAEEIRLWNTETGEELGQIIKPEIEITQLCFVGDSNTLLANSNQKQAYLFELQAEDAAATFSLSARETVTAISASRDGRYALTGSAKGKIVLWDIERRRAVFVFSGHKKAVRDVAFTSEGRYAVSCGEDRALRLWRLPEFTAVAAARAPVTFAEQAGAVHHLAMSPDGRQIVTAGADSSIRIWNAETGKEVQRLTGHTKPVRFVQFSPSGEWFISGGEDAVLRLWKTENEKAVQRFIGHQGSILAAVFSPTGKWIVSAGADQTARLWDPASGKLVRTFTGHRAAVTSAAFLPNGRFVLTGSDDQTVRMWEVSTGKSARTLTEHSGPVKSIAVSPTGRLALSGGEDKVLYLWDLSTGTVLHRFTGHTESITAAAFSADGLQALSASADGKLRVWDVAERKLLATLSSPAGSITGLATSSDGRHAFTCSHAGAVWRWILPYRHPLQVVWK